MLTCQALRGERARGTSTVCEGIASLLRGKRERIGAVNVLSVAPPVLIRCNPFLIRCNQRAN